ncbi:MAG: rhodanese-like domain-containing protein [Melioribacteraceae bacterium]
MLKAQKLLTLVILVLLGALTISFAQIKPKKQITKEAKAAVQHISITDVNAKIEAGEKFFLIDVRSVPEYLAGHIQGAMSVSRGLLEFKIEGLIPDANAEIIIYCKASSRGSLATIALMDMGYTNVKDMEGGFKKWSKEKLPFFNHHGKVQMLKFGAKETKPNGVGVLHKLVH